jgi:hypothetical protein
MSKTTHFVFLDHGMESFSAHILFSYVNKKSDATPMQ